MREEVENLVIKRKAKFFNTKNGFFQITLRQDIDMGNYIEKGNKKLKEMSAKHEVVFIDNSSINNACLNVVTS